MTQEDKKLLLVDSCARLLYGVKGKVYAEVTKGDYDMNGDMIFYDAPFDVVLDDINIDNEEIHVTAIGNEDTIEFIEEQQEMGEPYTIEEFKPYLRPMSSMTEEEKTYIKNRWGVNEFGDIEIEDNCNLVDLSDIRYFIDWLNAYHFDYRGLIEKGLAIEVTEENNPYK